jgi:hypothetical protein
VARTGEINRGKDEIADLRPGRGSVATCQRSRNLFGLFANFGEHSLRIIPIEADAPRFRLELLGAHQCGQGGRHPRKRALPLHRPALGVALGLLGLLFRLDVFP